MKTIYRFVQGEIGIYEAVEVACPRSDIRRTTKPDGSWLPKVGSNFPGAISFWTERGLKKYIESGLLSWHLSVVGPPVDVILIQSPKEVLYQDDFQVICLNQSYANSLTWPVDQFLSVYADERSFKYSRADRFVNPIASNEFKDK